MKVEAVHIYKYHNLKDISISLISPYDGLPCDRFFIMGGNASGKTSVLQAITLPLALATKKIDRVDEFIWGGRPVPYDEATHIELDICFSDAELLAISEIADMWCKLENLPYYIEPGDSPRVRLTLDGRSIYSQSASQLHQFLGPYYLSRYGPSDIPHELGGVLWLDIPPRLPMDILSDGEYRAVSILRATVEAPRGSIILIDDIDLHLDPAMAQGVANRVCKLQHQVIASTHSEAISNILAEYQGYRLEPCYI